MKGEMRIQIRLLLIFILWFPHIMCTVWDPTTSQRPKPSNQKPFPSPTCRSVMCRIQKRLINSIFCNILTPWIKLKLFLILTKALCLWSLMGTIFLCFLELRGQAWPEELEEGYHIETTAKRQNKGWRRAWNQNALIPVTFPLSSECWMADGQLSVGGKVTCKFWNDFHHWL